MQLSNLSKLVIFAAPLALAACGGTSDADSEPQPEDVVSVAPVERDLPDPDTAPPEVGTVDVACRANLAEPFIGETLDLDSRTALLEAVAPQAIIRFLEPGDEVDTQTPDESENSEGEEAEAGSAVPDRLNIRTDADDTITEVFCG